ncbi:hypothetical protein HYW76_05135 [Candidatus Pacearchaeota archaeon]|nr:hypothetical protein [Candidatus Pacearchaeota archaeon]
MKCEECEIKISLLERMMGRFIKVEERRVHLRSGKSETRRLYFCHKPACYELYTTEHRCFKEDDKRHYKKRIVRVDND